MTLADAFALHPEDIGWLAHAGRYAPTQWDLTLAVEVYDLGQGNYAYLGEDEETVFEVHGQAEPLLLCDSDYWQLRRADLQHRSGAPGASFPTGRPGAAPSHREEPTMQPSRFMHYIRLVTQARDAASGAGRYWTYRGDQWEALASRMDREYINPGDVLRAAKLSIRDRGEDGSVHLDV
jgi:hypothetical protein